MQKIKKKVNKKIQKDAKERPQIYKKKMKKQWI